MIDTHIHLVPNVDDGAKDLEAALEMARMAVEDGIDTIVTTPHYNIPDYDNSRVLDNFQKLLHKIKTENLNLKVYLGNEIHLNEEGVEAIFSHEAYSLANSKYYLIELPFHQYYPAHEELIFQIVAKGYFVILAHIERYIAFQKTPEKLQELMHRGCFGQLTSSYIVNPRTSKRALELIESGVVHIVASDAHNIHKRKPQLSAGYQCVCDRFGEAVANRLFIENPKKIIDNLLLDDVFIHLDNKKKKWYNFF